MDSAQLTLDKELLLRNVCYKISLLARISTSILDEGFIDETYHSNQPQQRREPNSLDVDNIMIPNGPIHSIDKQVNMSSPKDDGIPAHDQVEVTIPEQPPGGNKRSSRLKRFANLGDDSRKYQLPVVPDLPLGEGDASFHGSNNAEVAKSISDRDELLTNHNSMPKGLVAAVPPPFDKEKLRMKSIRDHRRIIKGSNQSSIESITSAAQQHGILPSIEQPKDGPRRKQQSALKLSKDDSKTELKSDLRLPPLVPPRPRVPSTPPLVPNDSIRDSQEQSLSAKKRRPKKPLFMRMIDEAQRRYEEDEKLKHEEYNKFKEHKAKRPTREEIKAHIALHDQQRELVKQRNEEVRKKMPVRPKGLLKMNGNDASPDSISMESNDSIIVSHVMRPQRDGSLESLSALKSPRASKNSSKMHPKKVDRRVRLGAEVTAVVSQGRENSQQPLPLSNDNDGGGAKPLEKSTMVPTIQPPSLASYVSSDWLVQCLHGDDWITGDHRWPQAPPPIDALQIM